MSDSHSPEAIKKHVKIYIGVFLALLVGTFVTVAMYSVHFESFTVTVAVALLIASIKAFLVAGYFMHLMTEKKMIYGILLLTVFFFIGMMALTLWSSHDGPRFTER